MIESVVMLLWRQASATRDVASHLLTTADLVLDGDTAPLSAAAHELERASSRLSGLELARVLILSSAGMSASVTADELVERVAADSAERAALVCAIADLREAVEGLTDARSLALETIGLASEFGSLMDDQPRNSFSEGGRHLPTSVRVESS